MNDPRVAAFSIPADDTERLVIHAPRGTIRRTSSGKLARQATRDWFLLSH
jgi:hypothetical protein